MSKHLEFMKLVVTKPVYVLKKDMVASKGGKKMSTLTEVIDCYISDITDEKVFLNGAEHRIKRLFVQSLDSGDYSFVGWVINSEMNYCMVCSVAFGMFTYQHHCKACGNIVCDSCSLNYAPIAEIEKLGAKRVCLQCYWGQEIVTAYSHKPPPPQPKMIVAPTPIVKQEPVVVLPEVPAEDPEVTMRKQQQAQFQKEAIERIGRHGSLAKALSTKSAPPPAPMATVEEVSPPKRQSLSRTLSRQPGLTRENSITRESFEGRDHSTSPVGGTNPMRASLAPTSASVSPVRSNNGSITTPIRSDTDSNKPAANSSGKSGSGGNQKLSSYGEMTTQIPVPGFVLKTKRNDQTKIFVNICSHASIPYKAESSSKEGVYDMDKQLYMLVGPPLEYTNEKDQSYCVIYDTVVHPDEVLVCSIDATGIARSRLCTQALELIAIHYLENLDPSYKILKISSNYKGGNESGGKVKTQPIVIPHKNAFHALHQMTTNLSDLESVAEGRQSLARTNSITPSNSNNNSTKSGKSNGQSSGVNPMRDEGTSRSSITHISEREHRSSTVIDSINRNSVVLANDSVHSGMDVTLKVTVKSISSASKMNNNNFSSVLDDLKTCQYSFKDMLITPEPGFVVSAQKVNRGQQIFVNVCHHPLVAMLTVKAALDKGRTITFDEYPSETQPCPYIVGAIDNEYVCNDSSIMVTPTAVGSKCIVIDIIIPSSIMLVIIQDETGDLRDRLAVDMLENVAKLNVLFDGNYTLPLVPGGRIGSNKTLTPVINQTEDEKKLYVMSFVGKFFKQGHGVKSWKERLVHIIDSKLKYFDLNSSYKGDFNIDDCNMTYVPNAECAAPMDAYPFKISNFVTGGEYMYCYVGNQSLRELFSLVIVAKIRQLSIAKDLITIPDLTTGWLKKQGHMVKNWKRRFFVLSYGVLKYYEKNGQEGRGSGENELGSVGLKGGTVKVVVNSEAGKSGTTKDCRMSVVSSNGKELLLEAESLTEKNAWFDALKKHINYANQYN